MATEARPHFLMLFQYELEFSPLVCLAELVCQRVEVMILERDFCTWILSVQPVPLSGCCSHGDWTSAQGHRCQARMPSPWQFAQHSTVISLAGISIFATCWLIQLHLLSLCHPKDWSWTYFVFLQAAGHLISWHHWTTESSQEVTWFRLLLSGIPIVNCWRWMGFCYI